MMEQLAISSTLSIALNEIEFHAMRSQGAGGQNVNKVSSAIHLRFNIRASSLPEWVKHRVLARKDQRITSDGIIVIKAQQFRTQEKNRRDALERLQAILQSALHIPITRIATKPTKASKQRRLDSKSRRSAIKSKRGRVTKQSDW
ncbi:aminoacyl-tRNA hydrolase [Marinibactrum halimedae]|uniref:Peptidyl-tRNA hydrolase n=2 Tax=Marinibactrum halimedae TaxID=1444977 RepID=A0AA37WR28_9GAMM|nr:alternative ribosome rescue aminoacyl-tRNA hydrolase ArfB [Marinibactrum halimedae]MCD9460201.1 aminoacyl-tRNA hydrolase [Marinibactrum halimedae]GLS27967.1 peptidyl-tRNA hydrolase [Marinibactrum halimedae]